MTHATNGAQPAQAEDEDPLAPSGPAQTGPPMAATIRILLVVALSLVYVREIMVHSQRVEAGHLVPQLSVICLAVLLAMIGEHIIFLSSPRWATSSARPIALGGFVFAAIILGLAAWALSAWVYETVWVSVVGIALTSAVQLGLLLWHRRHGDSAIG